MTETVNMGAIDPNLMIETSLKETDIIWQDVCKAPFELYGFYEPALPKFQRLPDDVGMNTSSGVSSQYRRTSGGRVRFTTDSEYIAIKCKLPEIHHMYNMSLVASSGFSLYLNFDDGSTSFYATFRPPYTMTDGYESVIHFGDKKRRMVQINFPLYNQVSELYIGVQDGSYVEEGMKYAPIAPFLCYGSSITQGGCVSRPGNCYAAIVSRRLNIDFINNGFSGSAKGEELMCNYLAGVNTSLFILDYDHNSPNAAHLKNTHFNVYDTLRKAQPDTPVIMISRPDFTYRDASEDLDRRDIVYSTYKMARERGDKNVYFVDGAAWLQGVDRNECTVDGTHPNDLGHYRMADILTDLVHNVLIKRDLMI